VGGEGGEEEEGGKFEFSAPAPPSSAEIQTISSQQTLSYMLVSAILLDLFMIQV
jgi:hypothetical protein